MVSSITIGPGKSAGREGPIIHIGAACGSILRQWTCGTTWERIILKTCGAAGIAATFNTPLGSVLFALENASQVMR